MCLIVVTFNTIFCSMIIDGRMPLYEGQRTGIYFIPDDQSVLFCQIAQQNETVSKISIYRHYKSYK